MATFSAVVKTLLLCSVCTCALSQTLYSLTYRDRSNGLDPRVEGPSKGSVISSDMMFGSEKSITITPADVISLVSNSKVALTVRSVSFKGSVGMIGAIAKFLDSGDNVLLEKSFIKEHCSYLFSVDVDQSDVRTIEIQPSVLAGVTDFTVGNIKVHILKESCSSEVELGYISIGYEITSVTSTNQPGAENILLGSGFFSTGSSPPISFSSTDGGEIEIQLASPQTVSVIMMETLGAKSVAIYMFDSDGKRQYRDTTTVDDGEVISWIAQNLFSPPEGVSTIRIELRFHDCCTEAKVQNFQITVCGDDRS